MKKHSKKSIYRQKRYNILLRKRSKNLPPVKQYGIIKFPPTLSIVKPLYRSNFLDVINKLKYKDKSNKCMFLNFEDVKTLYPDGAIYLLHQISKVENKKLLSGRVSSSQIVKSMFTKLGIHVLLGLKGFSGKKIDIVDRWKILSGTTADLDESYLEIEKEISRIVPDRKSRFVLQNAISEAISNVINHAYDDKKDVYKKWFLFFFLEPEKQRCVIVVSDLGKTIPKTIPVTLRDKWSINPMELVFGKSDSQLIEVATKFRRTATEEHHRGKGFNDILQVESFLSGAKVVVASRKGAWSSEDGGMDYKDVIEGTTVSWEVPFNPVSNVIRENTNA